HLLHVQREQEELRERGRADQQHRRVRRRQRPQAEDAQRQQRGGRAGLDPDERDDQRRRGRQQADGHAVAPAVLAGAADRVDEDHQAGGDRRGAGDVEVTVLQSRSALGEQPRGQAEDDRADRQVDEEDPGPAQVRGEHSAEQDADRAAASRSSAPDAEGDVALASLAEGRDDDRQRRRREQRAAEPLQPAGDDQRSLGPREPREQRAEREDDHADDEETTPTEQVREPAAEQQRAAEQDRVRGDHPLQARLREVEVALDRRQGDVDNRHVEDDHELRGDGERENEPAPLLGFGDTYHQLTS